MDRLSALRSFLRIAEFRSFTGAARRLGLSKSLVSRQISALEADLGVLLINRTTRRLSLTEAGQAYAERCLRILAELDEADQAVGSLQVVPKGRLRVTAPVSFATLHLSPILPRFLNRFPEIELDLSLSDRTADLVEEGFDLAVRIGRLAESSLVARKLCPMRRVVCASPEYLKAHGTPMAPADLARHSCLTHSELSLSEWRLLDARGQPQTLAVRGPIRTNNGEAIRHLALSGVGIAYLPTFFTGPDLAARRLLPLLETSTPQDSALYAVYPEARYLSPKVRALVDFLAESFTSPPYWDKGT